MAGVDVDLIVFTGDYMSTHRVPPATTPELKRIAESMACTHGVWGVWGNHDLDALRAASDELPIRWLNDEAVVLGDLPVVLAGMDVDTDWRMDCITAAEAMYDAKRDAARNLPAGRAAGASTDESRPFCLLLAHIPVVLPTAADLGVDLMLSGHTHGGQIRLPGKRALINSTDLPAALTSGVIRHRDTVSLTSRGLGEVGLPFRICCPPHLPIYTLERGPLPGEYTDELINVEPW